VKRAVSISIGSSTRNKSVEMELLGEKVCIERIGTDGSMEKAAQLFKDLDGKVDAFGVGGTDLGLTVGNRWYALHSVRPMVRYIKHTPVVDGGGLRHAMEINVAQYLEVHAGSSIAVKTALITAGVDRWDMAVSFTSAGYQCVFGDLMFALGIPIAIRSLTTIKILAAIMLPVVSRLPFTWIYPTGEKQEKSLPKWEKYYRWATVIAGDCHYIKRYMPGRLDGKVIVTNTTTSEDVERFRKAGVKYLLTSTPVLEGRSFGTNMMEAALTAVAGKGHKLTQEDLGDMLQQLGYHPELRQLN
jgi:hypothetical protein